MIKIILSLIITLIILTSSTLVSAKDSSTSGEVQGTTIASDSSSLASKLKDLEKQIASKAAQLKSEMTKKLQNKAYFGIITDISNKKITLESTLDNKQVVVNEYTDFTLPLKKGAKAKTSSIDDLSKGDFISTLGDIDDKNVLTAKKLIKSDPIATDSAKFIWGQIQAVSNGTIVLKTKDNQKAFVYTSPQTDFFLGTEEASLADVKVTKFMVGKGKQDKDGNIQASFVYLIPGIGFIKPEKKIASPSAKPTASTSAKPSITPKKK